MSSGLDWALEQRDREHCAKHGHSFTEIRPGVNFCRCCQVKRCLSEHTMREYFGGQLCSACNAWMGAAKGKS